VALAALFATHAIARAIEIATAQSMKDNSNDANLRCHNSLFVILLIAAFEKALELVIYLTTWLWSLSLISILKLSQEETESKSSSKQVLLMVTRLQEL
jgi:hypothetical protein